MSGAVYFDATLHPSRSLTRRGLVILISLVVSANMALALRALSAGGWPILPFLGLDVAALIGAFWLNNRAARMHERIVLDGEVLTITHVEPSGRTRTWRFEPAWVRVGVQEGARAGGWVTVTTHGKGVAVGAFLTPRERREIAGALNTALGARAAALRS
ncbi:MAG: DUF2244 domain-containing protein [Micropepsaceae bacterium]